MSTRIRAVTVVIAMLLAVLGLAMLTECATKDRSVEESAPTKTTEEREEATAPAGPEEEPVFEATYVPNGNEVAVVTTPKGVIKLKLYPDDAPNHVASFVELAQAGFYDGTSFHRVVPDFVVQGGDPNTKTGEGPPGTGGPGYTVPAEFNSRQHLEGSLAMARSADPNSAGSQFYICLAPQPSLDGQYTVFGEVTEGMDVVQQIVMGDAMESVVIENATE